MFLRKSIKEGVVILTKLGEAVLSSHERVARGSDSFLLLFTDFALGNISIYVDNDMDSSGYQQLFGDNGGTDIHIKETKQMRSAWLLEVSTN